MIVTGESVVEWVCAGNGGGSYRHAIGIGDQRDGVLVAGVVVESWNGSNAMLHIRADKPPVRLFWENLFDYTFNQLNCRRVSAAVDETNQACRKLVGKLGFLEDARLAQAGRNGVDVLIYVLWPENRRFFFAKVQS